VSGFHVVFQQNYYSPAVSGFFRNLHSILEQKGGSCCAVYTHNDPEADGRRWSMPEAQPFPTLALPYRRMGPVVVPDTEAFLEYAARCELLVLLDDLPTNLWLRRLIDRLLDSKQVPWIQCGHVTDHRWSPKESIRSALSRPLYRDGIAAVTYSPLSTSFLRRQYVAANVVSEDYSSDAARYAAVGQRHQTARNAATDLHLCFCGYPSRRKGILVVRDALEELKREFPHLRIALTSVGPSWPVDAIEGVEFRQLGYLDSSDATAAVYEACDFLLLPSYREPWGHVVIEAAAVGLPSIVSSSVGASVLHHRLGLSMLVCEPDARSLKRSLLSGLSLIGSAAAADHLRSQFRSGAAHFSHAERAKRFALVAEAAL
jgi:glycosyltransferase involved in cell wall biosynthesis